MKKLLTILTAGLLLMSCSKLTPYDELPVLNVYSYSDHTFMILDKKVIEIPKGQRLAFNRFEYTSIQLYCQEECKVNINGGNYFDSVKLR